VNLWAFVPEFRIVRDAQKPAGSAGSPDAGSFQVIVMAGSIAMLLAYPLAWIHALRMATTLQPIAFFVGVATLLGGGLLRRHCRRQLGASFTGDVRARPDQAIVQTGAYAIVRHPAYTAGMLMYVGLGIALGSWGSVALLLIAGLAAYSYRIAVEERALVAVVGEPYREFMRTRRRLIPFIY
jgi:protein-S-isoprenylcysteine O-methyltransferase Ste14